MSMTSKPLKTFVHGYWNRLYPIIIPVTLAPLIFVGVFKLHSMVLTLSLRVAIDLCCSIQASLRILVIITVSFCGGWAGVFESVWLPCFTRHYAGFLSWFGYDEQTIIVHLTGLLASVLSKSMRSLLDTKIQWRTKADHVSIIAQHCLCTCLVFGDLPWLAVDETLATVVLPSWCEHRLAPLLSAHFLGLYGDEVAAALHCPPPGCYAPNHLDCSCVPWSEKSLANRGTHFYESQR